MEAYYADIGSIPNVSNAKAARCGTALGLVALPLIGLPVLDGSRSRCDWGVDRDAARAFRVRWLDGGEPLREDAGGDLDGSRVSHISAHSRSHSLDEDSLGNLAGLQGRS